jgi:hypothetical protein
VLGGARTGVRGIGHAVSFQGSTVVYDIRDGESLGPLDLSKLLFGIGFIG